MVENKEDYFKIVMVEDHTYSRIKVIEESKHWLQIKYGDRELRLIKNNIISMEKL